MATKFKMKELTLSVVKKHLNIDDTFTEDDDYLIQLILVVLNIVIKRYNLVPLKEDEEYEDGVYESNLCFFREEELPYKCYLKVAESSGKCPICCPYIAGHRKLYYEPALLHGILLLIANLYANREPITLGTMSKIPYTLDYLLEPYKNYRIC